MSQYLMYVESVVNYVPKSQVTTTRTAKSRMETIARFANDVIWKNGVDRQGTSVRSVASLFNLAGIV